MKIRLKKTNVKRLASLTALSAGTLGITAGPANAGDVFWSGIVDKKVGFDKGFGTRADIAGPNGAGGILGVTNFSCCSMTLFTGRATVLLGEKHGSHGTSFHFLSTQTKNHLRLAAALPAGAVWGTAFQGKSTDGAAVAQWHLEPEVVSGTRRVTAFTPANRYLLFRFTGGNLPHDMYGWAQLSVTFDNNMAFYRFPDVILIDWAFDASGAQLPAGDRGAPQLIGRDSSALAPTGLAALALGASGVRAWRAARNGAASTQY